MLPWVTLLVLAPINGQFAPSHKSVISLNPPWTTVFQGEKVTLTCNGFHLYVPEKTTWYRSYHGEEIQRGNTLEVHESGKYRCQTQGSLISNSVHLVFSSALLILQAPLSVFQGDSVVLRCQAKVGVAPKTIKKNDEVLASLNKNSNFYIHNASLKDNGVYYCIGSKEKCCSVISNRVNIEVQELFPRPELTASPFLLMDGSSMTLTCKTQLPPERPNVQLQFRFFRERQTLGSGWSSSHTLWITAVWTEDSGFYWCEAETVTHTVRKQSPRFMIHVQSVDVKVQIRTFPASGSVFEGQELVFICSVHGVTGSVIIFWYKIVNNLGKGTRIQSSPEARLKISSVRSSDAGEYFCAVKNKNRYFHSKPVTRQKQLLMNFLSLSVPVPHPVLTLSSPEDLAFEGAMVTLSCTVQRGSLPILYNFYHENNLLWRNLIHSERGATFNFSLTAKDSGNYYCTADNGMGPQLSKAVSLFITIPVSRPVLTLRTPRAQTVVGDMVELHCEALRGSPILYRFYHEDVTLRSSSALSGGGASFNFSLTAGHSGSYSCMAENGLGAQLSDTILLSVIVPVSHPVLTFRNLGAQAVVGDVVELHCEALKGSPPILYQFYHEDVTLGNSLASSGGEASINLSLTAEHSGNYSCEANNGLIAQHSKVVTLIVTVPVSRPILTLRAPRAQAMVGDMVELRCEALTGSPPILYRFYHEDVTLGNSSAPSGGGTSFNLSLTTEHSGNYSCEADNGVWAQRSEVMTLSIARLIDSRSGAVATGVTWGLLGLTGLIAGALLLYFWFLRKTGGRSSSEPSRIPSDLDPQEPTYHNVPAWIELQPVYANVNTRGGDVVYSEVRSIQERSKHAVASDPKLLRNEESPVIYSQVKMAALSQSKSLSPHLAKNRLGSAGEWKEEEVLWPGPWSNRDAGGIREGFWSITLSVCLFSKETQQMVCTLNAKSNRSSKYRPLDVTGSPGWCQTWVESSQESCLLRLFWGRGQPQMASLWRKCPDGGGAHCCLLKLQQTLYPSSHCGHTNTPKALVMISPPDLTFLKLGDTLCLQPMKFSQTLWAPMKLQVTSVKPLELCNLPTFVSPNLYPQSKGLYNPENYGPRNRKHGELGSKSGSRVEKTPVKVVGESFKGKKSKSGSRHCGKEVKRSLRTGIPHYRKVMGPPDTLQTHSPQWGWEPEA
ncbi:Fc receptor-like protein 5 [Carlito syrichta]|uniref:Fc receptor-like protein 5 n=1 Tax=Carlito syrichta TaxID=1868482 RepID=A0A3Q0DVA7_CARSF|nr:Fc receptor-like protein 5 [Carlito syrichta]